MGNDALSRFQPIDVYKRQVMGRYLKIIGLLVLALALWQMSGAVFTSDGGVSTGDSTDIQAVTAAHSPVSYTHLLFEE